MSRIADIVLYVPGQDIRTRAGLAYIAALVSRIKADATPGFFSRQVEAIDAPGVITGHIGRTRATQVTLDSLPLIDSLFQGTRWVILWHRTDPSLVGAASLDEWLARTGERLVSTVDTSVTQVEDDFED